MKLPHRPSPSPLAAIAKPGPPPLAAVLAIGLASRCSCAADRGIVVAAPPQSHKAAGCGLRRRRRSGEPMLQPAMGPPTPAKPLLTHPAKACQGRQRATGHAATAGAVRSLDAVACGCAATPDPPEWSQAGARRTTGAAAWSLAVVASRVRPRRRSLSRRGENQREHVQWLDVGALEIRSIVVGSTDLLRMRSRSLLELRLRMRRLCVGPRLACRPKCAFAFARCWKQQAVYPKQDLPFSLLFGLVA